MNSIKRTLLSWPMIIPLLFLSCVPSATNDQRTVSPSQEGSIPSSFDLADLKKRTFDFFWEEADPVTGLIEDRAPHRTFSSIASTGFGITAYLIGVENGYVSRQQAAERVLKLLHFLRDLKQGPDTTGTGGYKGFYYHFLEMKTGERYRNVELSTIDTGLLMAGILSAMEYFTGSDETESEIRKLADELYLRIEWDWFLNDTPALSMGWFPEGGFIPSEWVGYNEAMILLVLALGSPTHAVPGICWDKWTETYDYGDYYGYEHVNFGPLFGHQYSHMYIDFRGILDKYMGEKGFDYFENSRRATYGNRAYCMDNPNGFKDYSDTIWGLTACDGPGHAKKMYNGRIKTFHAYGARGASLVHSMDDGTIAPTAAGGSVPFAPEICLPALEAMYNKYGSNLYGKYGFLDSFNPSFIYGRGNEKGWFDEDYIGIDQGAIIIMLENYQTGFVWDLMKRNKYITAGLKKAGFSGGWLDEAGH